MKRMNRVILSLLLSVGAVGAVSAQTQFLPQLAVGGPPGGAHFQTIVFLSNSTPTAVSGSCQLYDGGGNGLSVIVGSGDPQSSFDWMLGPGRSQRYVLTGRGSAIET